MNIIASTLAMLATLTMASMCVYTATVLAPAIAKDMVLDSKFIGPFMSVIYLLAALTGTITGQLIARFGAIRVCQLTLVSCALGMFAFAAMSLPMLALSAVLMGCAYGPFNPASAHVLSGLASDRWRPLIFSVKQLGVPLGGMIAGAITPLLLLDLGWRSAAMIVAVCALLPVVFLQPLRAQFDLVERAPASGVGIRGSLALSLGDIRLRRYTIVAFAYAGCQVCAGAFLVVYLTSSVGLPILDAGIALAVMQAGGVCGRLVWGSVAAQWLSARFVLALIGLATGLGLWFTAQITSEWQYNQILILVFMLGVNTFGWNGVLLSQIATLAPRGRAADATGGMQFVMFGGVVILPAAFAVLATSFNSYQQPFIILAGLAVLGAFLALGAYAKQASTQQP